MAKQKTAKRAAGTNGRSIGKPDGVPFVWNYRDEQVPRAGLPAAEAIAKRQRRLRRYVKTSAITFPFLIIICFVAVLKVAGAHPAVVNAGTSSTTSPGRTAATLEVEQWLAGDPAPLPGASIQSWDGAKDIAPTVVKTSKFGGGEATWTAELDSFTLVVGGSSNPSIYTATVEVALRPGGGAIATGGPSFTPVPATGTGSGWDHGAPWSGLSSNDSVAGPVRSAITGWLNAYTSGSESQLRLAVGDVRGSVHYLPLHGIASSTFTVEAAAPRVAPNTAVLPKSTDVSSEIVEVSVDLLWKGEKAPTNGEYSSSPETTLDLLVERANTAAPVVVAWGPPGTGPSLKPYQNAVSG